MFGQMEWLFWFVMVGGMITIIYLITTYLIEKKDKKDRKARTAALSIPFLGNDQLVRIEEGFTNSEPNLVSNNGNNGSNGSNGSNSNPKVMKESLLSDQEFVDQVGASHNNRTRKRGGILWI